MHIAERPLDSLAVVGDACDICFLAPQRIRCEQRCLKISNRNRCCVEHWPYVRAKFSGAFSRNYRDLHVMPCMLACGKHFFMRQSGFYDLLRASNFYLCVSAIFPSRSCGGRIASDGCNLLLLLLLSLRNLRTCRA